MVLGYPHKPVITMRPPVPSSSLNALIVMFKGSEPSHTPFSVRDVSRNFSKASLAFDNNSLYGRDREKLGVKDGGRRRTKNTSLDRSIRRTPFNTETIARKRTDSSRG